MRAAKRGRGVGERAPSSASRRKRSVARIQRARLLIAMASASREIGVSRVTVADVVARAGVSRRTFYELFSDCDDCLTATLEEGLRRAGEWVLPAYRAHEQWREAIRAGLEAFLAFLDSDRTFGYSLVIDSLAAGDEALAWRARVVSAIVDEVERGGSLPRAWGSASRTTAEGLVGGVLAILHARLLADPVRSVGPLAGELMSTLVLPYMGAAAAGREIARRPLRQDGPPAGEGDVLAAVDIRLTHRTVLVLRALAAQDEHGPGMSNRQVAEAAGIIDQGQTSKLLSRLAERGLLANGTKRTRGANVPNTWRLTQKGRRVERSLWT